MNVAIVGFAVEGQAAYRYWHKQGAIITICDQNPNVHVPSGVASQLGPDYLHDLARFDLIVRTVGMHPKVILDKNPSVGDKLTTAPNEFLRVCPSQRTIGVTGTKGKGTTSTLITKMLEAAGQQVVFGGNVGTPVLDLLPQITKDTWVVLELSSFQLYDIKHSPHIGVCLMVVPEHLNWHSDMEDYTTAKSRLFVNQSVHDIAIYFAESEVSHQVASSSPGAKIPFYAAPGAYIENGYIVIDNKQICATDELRLLGKHNWQNACAAVTAVWQALDGPDIAPLKSVLTTFTGLEHRLEFVREVNGVKYYDDSFGTTPETAMVAIEAFDQPKVIILGGSDKGASFDDLAKTVASNNVRQVITIGLMGPKIAEALHAQGYSGTLPGGTTMPEIVAAAQKAAQPGDVVLLSTACASFDMFHDYKDRGNQFKTAVGAL
ncbi:MAG TPA: UDP-N-acetylmuramoyl-L-alanine--D-glutamate ligase [Candidatus Saccharimonadales bacterium]|nr:UDP-N-acetylmuramoyl-L-alanine--D-glutamate ligase [Candidatus Saccharimonadales bacterium]